MPYNKFNFHKNTFCIFQQVDEKEIESLSLSYKSKTGSQYYFTENGVFRKSNHWGRAANCRWKLVTNIAYKNQKEVVAYANWKDFYPNNDIENLFYISIIDNQPQFLHKGNPNYAGELLRNAKETAKRMREIKEVLENDNWAKYLQTENYNDIKNRVIELLIATTLKFNEIKLKISKNG